MVTKKTWGWAELAEWIKEMNQGRAKFGKHLIFNNITTNLPALTPLYETLTALHEDIPVFYRAAAQINDLN